MNRRSPSRTTPSWLRVARYVFLGFILFLVLFGYQTARLYTDWLWFNEVGQPGVFRTMVGTRVTLFFGFGLLFFIICYFNLWMAQRLNAQRPRPRLVEDEREDLRAIIRRATKLLALGGSILMAFLMGANAMAHWSDYLQFTHAGQFGVADPIFHRDVGFYVFRLPFVSFLVSWLLTTFGITAVGVALIHYGDGALEMLGASIPTFAPYVRRHLLALLGILAVVYAFDYSLARYDLLYADNGVFFGAGYADLHARLPAIYLQMGAMGLTAILCFVNIWHGRAFRLPLIGLIAWGAISLLAGGAYPGIVQRFTVVPNQLNAEKQYIAHDLKFTQKAYGLDRVTEQAFSGSAPLTAEDLAADSATIENIRLWDWPQLALVYTAKQQFRKYYSFNLPPEASTTLGDYNIDVDRYRIGGSLRQVMLAPRELYTPLLPEQAQTWQNQRLQYTHGYGVVMSPVNRVDPDGLPEFFLSQIPVRSSVTELAVTRPQVYFGELTSDYVFVDSRQKEFDYPSGEGSMETRYDGKGGVRLSSMLVKMAWSMRLGDANMLLSSDLTAQSRILFRRGVRDRIQALAPYLNLDNDPYLVVDGGKLFWIVDCYTVSNRYPYSKPYRVGTSLADVSQEFNYIRNPVKAVVDAYDGTIKLYVSDKNDPILQTWSRIFPGVFLPIDQMPAGLREHIRYPEDLFRIQRDVYKLYHITDPQVYYLKEDAWEVPEDPTPVADSQGYIQSQRMMPYYIVMRLPGEKAEEFLMMTPFTPLSTPNMAAWMCAKCDPDDYGRLLVYRFPRGSNVNGPAQIMGQIKQRAEVSREMTLLNQQGSKVSFGNLLVIPVGQSLLYAAPMYVQASGAGASVIPEIHAVVVATADRIVMQPTLETAIAAIGGARAVAGAPQRPAPNVQRPAPSVQGTAAVPEILRRADDAYQKARQQQREYDRSLDDLGKALQDLQEGLGVKQPPGQRKPPRK